MRKFSKKQYLAAGAAAVVVLGGAGAAFAYWTSTGTGTGSATTGTSSNFQVDVANVTLGDLTPGGPSDTVGFTVTNNNTGHQLLSSTQASVVDTSDPGCTAADFSVSSTGLDAGSAYGDLAHGDSVSGTFTVQMIDRPTVNQNACKGVTVHLQVVANS
jgi:hypothetical protein